MKFFGRKLEVKVRKISCGPSYYNPETHSIYISTGVLASLARSLVGRSNKWLLGHELGHAFLEECNTVTRRKLERVFGSLADRHYDSSATKEVLRFAFGYDREQFISARASLCSEEDFSECSGFLYAGGDPESQAATVRRKLRSFEKIVYSKKLLCR